MKLDLPYADDIKRTGPLAKPSAVRRIADKQDRKAEVSKAKSKAERADRQRLAAIREACYQRDKGRCRACGLVVHLHDTNALLVAEAHHLIYRSKQGSDETTNRVILCRACHEAEHRAQLQITGDPDAVLTFTELDATSGRQVRTWESPCPK